MKPQAEPILDVVPADPPTGRKFPCPKCAARLDFDPSSRALACPYCGHKQVIQPSAQQVSELDWEAYWQRMAGTEKTLAERSSEVKCHGCGAIILLQDNVATDQCPYCATHLENQPEAAHAMIQPGGVLPFAVSHREAISAFDKWIASRWFAPSSLRHFAHLGKLAGAYVPFWTFDSMTYTHYTGQRGDNYFVTETYTDWETDAQGKRRGVTKTREVVKIRWTPVSGQVRHFFDDVLVHAAHSLPDDLVYDLGPWDLKRLEAFRPDFLSGFQTERYTIGLQEGFRIAQGIMDETIDRLCRRDIGGDHQQLHTVRTQHVGVTFKHILLPMWMAVYRYHNKPYRILINGRTGRVTGNRPYSWLKITLFVLAILALLALLLALLSGTGAGQGHGGQKSDVGITLSMKMTVNDAAPKRADAPGGERLFSNRVPQRADHQHFPEAPPTRKKPLWMPVWNG